MNRRDVLVPLIASWAILVLVILSFFVPWVPE